MDNYCRTCMRDSNKFSPIFEEITYGGISLQEAIEDVCQLEISIGDGLSLYVCRDCALKLYDIVRFKMDAHEVCSAMRKLMAIHPRIKVENDESIEEASPSYPEIDNIKVEECSVRHSNEAIHPRIKVENDETIEEASPYYPEIENIKVEECSVSHSSEAFHPWINMENDETIKEASPSYPEINNIKVEEFSVSHSNEAIHPRIKVENDESIEEASPSYPEIDNIKVEEFSVSHSNEAIHPRIKVENDESIEEASPYYPEIENIKVEECSVSHSSEAIHPRIKVENDESIEEASPYYPEIENIKVEECSVSHSSEAIHPWINMENDETIKEASPSYPEIDNIKVEEFSVSHSSEVSYNANPDPHGNATISDAWNFEPSQPSVKVENSIRGTDSFEVNIPQGDVQNKFAAVFRDTPELPSIFLVNRESLKDPEVTELKDVSKLKKHQKIHEICRKSFSSDDRNNIDASCSSELLQQGSTEELDKLPIQVLHRECENFNKNPTIVSDTNIPIHEGESIDYPKSFNCDHCSKVFYNKNDLLEHLILHYGQRSYSRLAEVRKTVNHLLPDSDSMNEHGTNVFKRNKEESVRLRNKSCGKESVVDCALNTPETVRDNNSAEKPLACKYCSKMFQSPYHLRRHELIHTGEKPFACKYCSKMFQSASHLRRHELIHTGEKPFACKYCSKTFNTAGYRKTHEMIHTGEKPFTCKYCSQKFTTSFSRNNHELLHSGEKPFPCKVCSKTFARKCNLNRHELIHTRVA